jgi:competence CoiA-like predicted nuclease
MSLVTCLYNDNKISIKDFDLLTDNNKKNKIKCICCETKVIAKLGKIKAHHFAHEEKIECDSFRTTDSMTFWHQYWQAFVNTEFYEVIIKKDNKKHIADIYNLNKELVIEIQHSNISPEKMKEREIFYDNMIWIIDETTKCCNECEINFCNECDYYEKICDKCKNRKKCCNNKIKFLIEGETFVIITNINKPFFLSASKPVFLHIENYILKFIKQLDNNYYFCEKIKMKKFIEDYFPVSEYHISKVVKSINELYKNYITSDCSGDFIHIFDNDKITIPCDSDIISSFSKCGFSYYQKRKEYVYFFDKNKSYCYTCYLNIRLDNSLRCDECAIRTEEKFTNNWYNIFVNNNIVTKEDNSKNYSSIKLNIEEPIIIKTKNDKEIKITDLIIFNNDYDSKYHKNKYIHIYFICEFIEIEKLEIYNKIFYRIKEYYPEGCLLDMYSKNLYLTLNYKNKYTYLEPIKRKREFLKELSNITNQQLKWNIKPLEIEYEFTNYDEQLENEDTRIKFIFYCIEFLLESFDYYKIVGLLSCYTKNKTVLELYLKWLKNFRLDRYDDPINFGKYNGYEYCELPYEYLIWLREETNKEKYYSNITHKLELYNLYINQHPEQCKKIFYEKDKKYVLYIDYFKEIKCRYDNCDSYDKIIIEDNIYIYINEFKKNLKSNQIQILPRKIGIENLWTQLIKCCECGNKKYSPHYNNYKYYAICKICFDNDIDYNSNRLAPKIKSYPDIDFID